MYCFTIWWISRITPLSQTQQFLYRYWKGAAMMPFRRLLTEKPAAAGRFDPVRAFTALGSAEKMALCDTLADGSSGQFWNMVRLLWPSASESDGKKLQRALLRRLVANDA